MAAMSRIVLISPYRDLSRLTQAVAEELGIPIECHEGWLDQVKAVIDGLTGPPVDVFISRGGTAASIAQYTDVPVVSVDTGPFDILACCDEARRITPNIAITSFAKPYIGMRLVEKVMGVPITDVVFCDQQELEAKIAALAENGEYCVVGGGPSVMYAKRYGLPSVFLRTSPETVREALVRAREIARLRREEKRRTFRLKAILDHVYDGVIAVDGEGRVEIFNRKAEQIMGLAADQVVGRPVAEVIPNTRIDEVLRTGRPETGEFQDIGDVRIVTNRIPVKDGSDVVGVVATFEDVSRVVQMERRVRKELAGQEFRARFSLSDIIGESKIMKERKQLALAFARSDLTVFIYGPSGTGKEMFAQGIHQASKRRGQPFVAVNCAALPPTLLESELFGYEEGAFTGARRKGKHGLFELAHGGTIFLDEIDALPLDLQGRLLRVLQEREVLRVGGEMIIPVDIRVIAATNAPPEELLAENRIRRDLYYRLNVLYLELPSLAERREDIIPLARHFLPRGGPAAEEVLSRLTPYLERYSWPGNVRELFNLMQRLTFYLDNFASTPDSSAEALLRHLAPNILTAAADNAPGERLRDQTAAQEKAAIRSALAATGSVAAAARRLGIGKSTLWRKLRRLREAEERQG